MTTSTEGDLMSRNRSLHPVPRGGIDPIECEADALPVLALGAPYGHDTIVVLLDSDRCGCSVMVVTDTVDAEALFRVIDIFVGACVGRAEITGVILATSRPDGDMRPDDVHRWLEASDQCRAGGLVLVEWFVLGRSGALCPRELFGEPPRWAP
jgi:hypothetical protein